MQWPEIEYPNIYDYLINTPGRYVVSDYFRLYLIRRFRLFFLKRLKRAPNNNHKEADC